MILNWFWAHFESCLGSDSLNYIFVSGLFQGHLLQSSPSGNPDNWSSRNKVFGWNVLQKQAVSQKSFFDLCFSKALGLFY